MAHLKCAHERRVMVIRNATLDTVIRHRSDGGACNSRFVAIGEIVFEPAKHGVRETAGTSQDEMFGPLGPMVIMGAIADAITRADKLKRQVKKRKKAAQR